MQLSFRYYPIRNSTLCEHNSTFVLQINVNLKVCNIAKQAQKGFRPPCAMWEFFSRIFQGGCSLEEFFERYFWEDFFGRTFLGGFIGEDFLGGFFGEELVSRN